MTRPTRVHIDASALLHNVRRVKTCAPGRKVIAMVKANAYGCGLSSVLPVLEGQVDAFGVASLEEALAVRRLGSQSDCILFQGIFGPEELNTVVKERLQCVVHQPLQLQWLLNTPLSKPIHVWVKVDTGMHRLGFAPDEVDAVINALQNCPWVRDEIGLMTHLARADEPLQQSNQQQLQVFQRVSVNYQHLSQSIANSAAILSLSASHLDVVRPGIMLYGVSPFENKTGTELGLVPVMRFVSAISAIHHYPPQAPVGYGGTWWSEKPSIIGVVPVGYGDGYPRHIQQQTPIWVNGMQVPIVGRVSMDMLTVDLTCCPDVRVGDQVELWGPHIPVEAIARSAGTIAYELLCQLSPRVRQN